MNNKQEVVICRAPSGHGKSTYAKTHYIPLGYVHLEADMYFSLSGEYKFDPKKLHQAHSWCQNQFIKALNEGKSVVVSNTFIKLWELKFYLDECSKRGIIPRVIRLKTRFKNVHGVPEEKVDQMVKNMQDYLNEIIVE